MRIFSQSLLVICFSCLISGKLFSKDVPSFSGWVVDSQNYLSSSAKEQLSQRIIQLNSKTNIQAAVLITASLEGEEIASYALKVVEDWKLGKKGTDRGVLLLLAVEDRKSRIEVGYGLEGDLPDAKCKQILASVRRDFRQRDYLSGLSKTLNLIESQILKSGVPIPDEESKLNNPRGLGINLLFLLVVLIVTLKNMFSSFRYRRYGGGVTPRGFRRGSSSGYQDWDRSDWGGGGFGGGGGGGFGGGGSSDSW